MCCSVSPRPNLAVVDSAPDTQVIPADKGTVSIVDPRLGAVLGDSYRITRTIASGGMGTVYEAMHVRLQQRFSVKFLDHQLARNAEAYARFRQEAEIAASLDHDAIVQVVDFNTDTDGSPYMVMEYVDGVTLDAWMHGRRATPREVMRLFDPLCSALAAAHSAGIVHRDLKPTNVMVRGQIGGQIGESNARLGVKLLDFGISKMKSSAEGMTRTNVVMGTPNYMSPEQASGNTSSVDATTDIFALGAILYELLSGRRAFEGTSTPSLLHAIVYDQPTSLATLCPDLPSAVVAVVEKCLAKQPADRFTDTPSLMVALRGALRVNVARRTVEVATVEPTALAARSVGTGLVLGWIGSVAVIAVAAVWAVNRSAAVVSVPEPPAAAAAPPAAPEPIEETGFRDALATPGAFVLESGSQLYRADPRGLSYWSDPEAETVMRPLPSAAHVTAIGRAREGDVLVGQADGTVTRWDRELREVPWQHRVGTGAITSIAAAAGYLALAIGDDVHLVHAESGKPLKKFTDGPAVALVFTRHPSDVLLIIRAEAVELVDADKRKSLGTAPFSGRALRAELVTEPIDAPAEIGVDFMQGDWIVQRRFRVHSGRRGQVPRLEPVTQHRL